MHNKMVVMRLLSLNLLKTLTRYINIFNGVTYNNLWKNLCWSLVFIQNYGAKTKIQNQIVDTITYFIVLLSCLCCFLCSLPSVFLLITGNLSNHLQSTNTISNVGSCGDGLFKKNSKLNRTRIFAPSCQGIWIYFLNLELE